MRVRTLALVALALSGCLSSSEHLDEARREPVELSGRVVVTGSEPNVMLVIVTDDSHYELVGEFAQDLWKLQQRQVTVRGRIVRQALGPGFPARLAVDGYTS
ncbi:MAG: hypothetical protein OXE53_18445 [Deltaproteobacteria bacterium]|nr:hypothetical protein [Deltaproteobacteria bacterium]